MGRICDSPSNLPVFSNFLSSRHFKIHLRVVSLLSYYIIMGGRGFMKLSLWPDAQAPHESIPGSKDPGDTLPFSRAQRFVDRCLTFTSFVSLLMQGLYSGFAVGRRHLLV